MKSIYMRLIYLCILVSTILYDQSYAQNINKYYNERLLIGSSFNNVLDLFTLNDVLNQDNSGVSIGSSVVSKLRPYISINNTWVLSGGDNKYLGSFYLGAIGVYNMSDKEPEIGASIKYSLATLPISFYLSTISGTNLNYSNIKLYLHSRDFLNFTVTSYVSWSLYDDKSKHVSTISANGTTHYTSYLYNLYTIGLSLGYESKKITIDLDMMLKYIYLSDDVRELRCSNNSADTPCIEDIYNKNQSYMYSTKLNSNIPIFQNLILISSIYFYRYYHNNYYTGLLGFKLLI